MSQPLISVIIPCYNYAAYMAETIESVLQQTYSNIEIIIIDDGSTDHTAEVAASYAGRVHYYFQPNRGLSAARNAGFEKAAGDYVVHIDADDKLYPNFVERTLEAAVANPDAAFIYTQQQYFEAAHNITDFPQYNIEILKKRNYIPACTLIRADVLRRFSYDTKFTSWEDWDFYLTLAEAGLHGMRVNMPLILYRKHADQKSMLDTFGERRKIRTLARLRFKHWRLYGLMDTLRFSMWAFKQVSRSRGGRSVPEYSRNNQVL
ncbi:MAG TPA: glycosyltransferase [Candidatus Saccharimonadales bacterium]